MCCLFCHAAVIDTSLSPGLLPHCPFCLTPYVLSFEDARLLTQCCECGMFLSGPYQGVVALKPTGTPDLSLGVSHGMCQPCADSKLATWLARRHAKSTTLRQ